MTLFDSTLELFRGPRRGHRTAKPLTFESLELRELMTTSPFYIFNNTQLNSQGSRAFSDEQIYIALFAQDYAASNPPYYYFDQNGNATLTTAAPGGVIPTFQLSQLTPAPGPDTYVINLPQELGGLNYGLQSARMYFFMSDSTSNVPALTVNGDAVGSVNGPIPGNNYYDYVEFSLNAPNNPTGNLNIDTTNVDQLGVPIRVLLDSTDPGNIANGVGIDVPRDQIFEAYTNFTSAPGDPYRVLLDTNTGKYGSYRIQNPSDYLNGSTTAGSIINVQTVLQQEISATTTTFLVYSGETFPDPNISPFTIQVHNEQMLVTGAASVTGGVNWTVTRGVNGTQAAPHVVGANISQTNPTVTSTQTAITVGSSTGYPDAATTQFNVRVDGEIMTVTGYLGGQAKNLNGTTTWTVVRGVAGSVATTHNQNAVVYYDSVTLSPFNSYYNEAIDDLFTKYQNGDLLYVQSSADGTTKIYQGSLVQVDSNGAVVSSGGTYVLQFVDSANPTTGTQYNVYYPFLNGNRYYWAGYTPQLTPGDAPPGATGANYTALSPSEMVFACNGVFADNTFRKAEYPTDDEQKVLADLENQIVSALNRGVGQLQGVNYTTPSDTANTWADHSQYYEKNQQNQPWNEYAQFLHKTTVSIDGKNYGFPFDDQQGFASDIAVASFNSARIVLESWSDDTPPPTAEQSVREFLASYLALYGDQGAESQSEDLGIVNQMASSLEQIEEDMENDVVALSFASYLNDSADDEDEDDGVMPTVVPSARIFTASRLGR